MNAEVPVKQRASVFNVETVTEVHHWTDRLFNFRCTRDPSFRFQNGQFAMIGLEIDGKPLLRAYSMASANHEEFLEFFSIKVPDGPLTSRLQLIQPGDKVLIGKKPTGTLVLDNLRPGKRLFLLSTGTGIAPFVSLIKDPEAYDRFEKVILVHGCREVAELAYGEHIVKSVREDELLGELVVDKLVHYTTVTREAHAHRGRIPELIANHHLTDDLGLPPIDKAEDRIMLCGSPGLLDDMRHMLVGLGWDEGNSGEPGDFVIERAFVER
ncbi:ferredoxin--NADP reductase [Methyloraptor flagellatus]|uniref:ferredoxin--NADP(+) reductase n=1 Tax=Methyloraptor flagellatus TaxID=3162530 RepID=A0AAU7XBH4_9HYPH